MRRNHVKFARHTASLVLTGVRIRKTKGCQVKPRFSADVHGEISRRKAPRSHPLADSALVVRQMQGVAQRHKLEQVR